MRRFILAMGVAACAVASPAAAQQEPPSAAPHPVVGFIDLGYLGGGRDSPEGFRPGRVIADIVLRPARRWTFFGEVEARVAEDELRLALERLVLGYEVGPRLRLSVGQHRTPIGYWNANIHPGALLRTTIDPPALLDPGRGVLPIHWFGLIGEGRFHAGGLGLGYVAGLGNGRGPDFLHPAIAGDTDGHRAWTLGVSLEPEVLHGLQLGAGLYDDRVLLGPDAFDERILALHAAWTTPEFQALAEYADVEHVPTADGFEPAASTGYYVQLATRLPGAGRAFRPYLRVEAVDIADDPVLAAHGDDYAAATIGMRYDFAPFGAAKAEFRSERAGTDDARPVVALQLAFGLGGGDDAEPAELTPPPVAAGGGGGPPPESAEAAPEEPEAPVVDERERARERARAQAAARRRRAVAVVVAPGTDVDSLSLGELRRIFQGDRRFWSVDRRIVPIVPSLPDPQRRIAAERLYGMAETDFRHLWLSRIFRTPAASGPKVVGDIATARQFVTALDGAIGLLPATAVGSGLRIVAIDGRLPGEPGYPLQ